MGNVGRIRQGLRSQLEIELQPFLVRQLMKNTFSTFSERTSACYACFAAEKLAHLRTTCIAKVNVWYLYSTSSRQIELSNAYHVAANVNFFLPVQ